MDRFTIMMDSSAISSLYEESSSEEVVSGLQAAGDIRVSAISVLEAIADGNQTRRAALLDLQKLMTRNARPYDMPEALVRKSVDAYSKSERSIEISVSGEHVTAWEVIGDTSLVKQGVAEFARTENAAEEEKFYTFHRELRSDLDKLFGEGVQRPSSAREYMQALLERPEQLHKRIAPIYSLVVGTNICIDQVGELLTSAPSIKTYFLALAYADYKRSVAPEGYGRNNAGLRDLSFAAYLPHISMFVTGDQEQETALRHVGGITNQKCEVVSYRDWIKRILL